MAGKARNVLSLNHQAVRTAKAIDGRQTEFNIIGQRGLKLLVMPTGVGSFVFRYDVRVGNKRVQRKVTLGNRDAMDLGTARRKADELRRAVENGADPIAVQKAKASALTLRQLFEERCANPAFSPWMRASGLRIRESYCARTT